MMSRLEIGLSRENADRLFSDDGIKKLSTDHYEASYIDHPLVQYYSAFVGDDFVGAFMVIKQSVIDYEVHLLLMREAVYYTRMLCGLILDECFREAHRVTAKINGRMNTMQNLVTKLGFKFEGETREACMIGGEYVGVKNYGLLKSEWENKNGFSR